MLGKLFNSKIFNKNDFWGITSVLMNNLII